MTAPLGVITTTDGSLKRLVYNLSELAVHTFTSTPRYPAFCADADCMDPGCFVAWTEPGEAYHCCACLEAYDADFQCATASKVCISCCGHQTCQVRYDALVSGRFLHE